MILEIDDDVAVVSVALALRSYGLDVTHIGTDRLRVSRGHGAEYGDQKAARLLEAVAMAYKENSEHG